MATYITNVTDYIPQIQPFSPDYNYLGNILQTRQSRYDAAHKQLSSVYGTLLNSPLLRDENIKSRDEFFKSIDGDIKKIAGLDLSLKQNQDAAMQVFKPFYENKDLVNDMVWTKNYHTQLMKAENLKYCTDPDKCGGSYWDGGVKVLNYKAQEFKNASKEEALNMEKPYYTPSINIFEKSMKLAKDNGFKVSFDHREGGYIVTDKNGERMVAPLRDFFISNFGNDADVVAYYKAQAFLKRKDYTTSGALMKGEDQASLEYMNQVYQIASKRVEESQGKINRSKNQVNSIMDGLNKVVSERKLLKSDTDILKAWQSLRDQQEMMKSAEGVVKTVTDKLKSTSNYSNNSRAMNDHLDDLMAYEMLYTDSNKAAKAYADLTSERKLEADPYSLAAYRSSLELQKQYKLEGYKHELWKDKERLKSAQKKADIDKEFSSGFIGDLPGAKGLATPVTDENMALKENQKKALDIYKGAKASSVDFVKNLSNELSNQFNITGKDPAKQNALAATAQLIFKGTNIDSRKIVNGDPEEVAKLQNLDAVTASKIYDQAVKVIDPKNTAVHTANIDWARKFWYNSYQQRHAIAMRNEMRGQAVKHFEGEAKKVTNGTIAEMIQEDNSQEGLMKADLLGRISKLGHGGFLPNLEEGSQSLKNIAHDFANQNQGKLGGWQNAYSFALQHADDVASKWYSGYGKYAQSFNHLEGFGKSSNAKMSGAYMFEFDSAYPSNNNTLTLAGIAKDAKFSEGLSIIQFGDAGEIRGTDTMAKQVFDQYYTDLITVNPKRPDRGRPKGTFTAQRIGGSDDKYMAATIMLDSDFINKHQGTKANPGITWGMQPGTQLTMFIPVDHANNSFYQSTGYNDYDFILDKAGRINIDDLPSAGNVAITRKGNQTAVSGFFIAPKTDGTWEKISIDTPPIVDADAAVLYQDLSSKMLNLAVANDLYMDNLRSNKGVDSIMQLINQLKEELTGESGTP